MRRSIFATALIAFITLGSPALAEDPVPAAPNTPVEAVPQEKVLAYVEELMRWQKDAAAINAESDTTRELLLQDNLQQTALIVLRNGLAFAKLQAALAPAAPVESAPSDGDVKAELTPAQRMLQRNEQNNIQIAQLQAQIPTLPFKERDAYQAKLRLAVAKRRLYSNFIANIRNAGTGNGLADQIAKLEKSVPELDEDTTRKVSAKATTITTTADAAAPGTTVTTTTTHPVSVFTLASDMFDTLRQQRALHTFADETDHLQETSRALIKPMRTAIEELNGQGTTANIDEQTALFNRIGAVLMPLGEATMNLNASKTAIDDWQKLLDQRLQETFRQFLVKLIILAITIAIPLAIGEMIRRAIKKYIRDGKRQRQANTARRVVVGVVIVFILLFNFISDFSSFATFAGFMTAGLAVALQSVLLSLVAHFFFYGRYGVRAGDRVNVAGVTGDILQIGIVRFYMRELKKQEDGTLAHTGKTVAFPNSILFQPTAFYKYVPE